MSFQAMAWAIKQRAGNPTRKAVLMAVANYADEHGRCFPSQTTLAHDVECSRRTILDTLAKLEEIGLLKREARRRQNGSWTSDLLTLPCAESAHGKASHVQLSTHPIAKSAHPEPITEPITIKNGNLNGEGKKDASREKLAQGFKHLSSLITIQEPGRRSA